MAIKFAQFLPFICALIALSTARVQFDASTVEDNEISVFPKEQVKVVIENDDKQLLDESKNEVTVAPVASVDSVDSVDPAAPADPIATVASVDPVASVDSVTPVAPVDPEAPPENESIKKMFTPDQWPPQELKPLKVAETDRKPVEVLIPSSAPVNPPTNFVNKFKINDFDMPNYAVGVDQRCEYYYGSYVTGKDYFPVFMKRSRPGYENILYQEAQILQSLAGKEAFPQMVYYDGRNLGMNTLCSTWAHYTAVRFQSGGMSLEEGYNMMHQMLDALKELHSLGYVHRDISANNIAFGCYYYKDLPKINAPYKLSETSKLSLYEFGATENVVESILNKFYLFAGSWDFVSNATMHDEKPMYVQDAESLGYVLLYGLNGGFLAWSSQDGKINIEKNIALKNELNLDENLDHMKGDEQTINKAKRDIAKYFRLIREHTQYRPEELLDYEALKACLNIKEITV